MGETSSTVIKSAFDAIFHLKNCGPIQEANDNKLQDCISTLCADIRDLAESQDMTVAGFSDEQTRLFTAATQRLHLAFSRFDITTAVDNDGDRSHASVGSVIVALVDRGQLGLVAEEQVCLPNKLFEITILTIFADGEVCNQCAL